MKKLYIVATLVAIGVFLPLVTPVSAPATRAEEALWADGKIWDTILTPATFKPPKNLKSVDKLYVFDFSGLSGQRPVAEAAPYERDYNGGRWWVQKMVFTASGMAAHDPDGDGTVNFELKSDTVVLEHVALGHITITSIDMFFVCPLLRA